MNGLKSNPAATVYDASDALLIATAERLVLGRLMLHKGGELLNQHPYLEAKHFAYGDHAEIFGAIWALHGEDREPNLIEVSEYFRKRGRLKAIGDAAALGSLAAEATPEKDLTWAVDRVVAAHRKRLEAQIIKEGAAGKITPDEVRARLEETERPPDKRAPLTIRTIDEILGMEFDPADLILPNGYLTAGDLTAICGMGGVGKSRLTMQLALCCRAGRDFLGWPTNGRDLRFLFLQTENSCRRLQNDLEKMLSAFRPEEREHLTAGIFFHTLEGDDDGFLALDLENKERAEHTIMETAANVVVFDPLRDFSLEDLNSDKFMGDTLRDILRVTKRGNPKRVPLAVHHSGTGKAGIQKVTGFDRSSFGRNSKVLQLMVRAQINVAPIKPNDNSAIIIASGKCNNAPEFEAFGARLSFETMLYAPDPDFDIEGWQEQVASTKKRRTFSPQIVRDLDFSPREFGKKALAKLIRDETGCGTSRAYELIDEAKQGGLLRFSKITKTYAKA